MLQSSASANPSGILGLAVVIAAVLSVPACILLLSLYRRAVVRGMSAESGTPAPAARPTRRGTSSGRPPIEQLGAGDEARGRIDADLLHRALAGRWRQAAVYLLAGLVYAGLMAAAVARLDARLDGNWRQAATLVWLYLWPAVIAVLIVAAYDLRRRLQVGGLYMVAGIVVTLLAVPAMERPDPFGLVKAWTGLDAPATILLAAFLWRPIRAVGPMVLAFLLVAALGSQSILWWASTDGALLRGAVDVARPLTSSAHGIFWGMVLTGTVAFSAAVGWPLLRFAGARYRVKRFSDQQLTVDAMFIVFALVQSTQLSSAFGVAALLAGVLAFAGYKVTALLGFRGTRKRDASAPSLLLLRVFRLGRRAEKLFGRLRRHWQPLGSIRMIAGPDLVTSLVEPHEFLDFVGGRLSRRFIGGADDLRMRVQAMDNAPDPDGLHRVSQFFCRADTWQAAVRTLAAMTDRVLMDLRGFSATNKGCLFELGCLLGDVDLDRVVFLVDETTDPDALNAAIASQWSQMPLSSPNRRTPAPPIRLLDIGGQSERELSALLRQLLAEGSAAGSPV